VSTSTTMIGDRRRAALQRSQSVNRHPSTRDRTTPLPAPPAVFYVMAAVIALFVMLGLVMVMSASSISEFHKGKSPWGPFIKQAMWAVFGTAGLVTAMRVPLHFWRRMVVPTLIVCSLAMFAPLVPGLGVNVNGARAWIAIGGLTVQPSEFLKLASLLFCAHLLAKRQGEMHDPKRTIRPVLWIGGLGAALSMVQGDLGSAIVLAAIIFVMLFIAGAPLMPLAAAGVAGASGAMLFVFSSPFRKDRFTAFLDIAAHKDHLSYQTYQAMIALAQGGVTGEGVGRGSSKLGEYLPLAHSDFIFAVIAEELGFIGIFAVIGGFLLLAYAGMQVALMATDQFARLIASGIVSWFIVQAVINAGGVVGLMPVTGLTLPFFSAGGSSLFVTMTAAGLLLNVGRRVR